MNAALLARVGSSFGTSHPVYLLFQRMLAASGGGGGGPAPVPAVVAPPAVAAASAVGVALPYARQDHTHAGPVPAAVAPPAVAAASAVGTLLPYAREDHTHAGPVAAVLAPPNIAVTSQLGVSPAFAHADHTHGFTGVASPFPARYDLSVNEARVENAQSSAPVMVTGTTLNAAGAFTGGGTGNKAIFGFKGHSGRLLNTLTSFEWNWEMISPLETIGLPPLTAFSMHYPYMNLIVEVLPLQYKIFSIDPNENARQPLLDTGTLTGGPSVWNFLCNVSGDTNLVQVVSAFAPAAAAAGIVPAVPAFSASPGPGVPVPAYWAGAAPQTNWQNNSFKWSEIIATFPTAKLIDVYTADGGLPGPSGTNTPTPSVMLVMGDSGFRRQRYLKVNSVKINGVDA